MEPDRSMTRARFLALADIYLLIGEEAFFLVEVTRAGLLR